MYSRILISEIYATEFTTDRHWVLTDHKIRGHCVVPRTTYLEVARVACQKYYQDSKIEFKDVIFISPLVVAEGQVKEIQTILTKETDHIQVAVASKLEVEDRWLKHFECKVQENNDEEIQGYDLEEIRKRCPKVIEVDANQLFLDEKKGFFKFGPRWKNLNSIKIGEDQVLIELELPEELKDDLKEYLLHPALVDNALNLASQSVNDDIYLPLSYKSFKFFGTLPGKFYSYVRKKESKAGNQETVPFDVTLMDESGKVYAEVEDYYTKKADIAGMNFKELSGQGNFYYETIWVPQDTTGELQNLDGGNVLILKDEKGIADQLIPKLKNEVGGGGWWWGGGGSRKKILLKLRWVQSFKKIDENKYTITGREEDYERLIKELKETGLARIIHLQTITVHDQIIDVATLEETQKRGLYSLFYLTRALVNNKVKDVLDITIISDYVHEVSKLEEKLNPHNASLFGLAKVIIQEHSNFRCRCIDIDSSTSVNEIISEIKTENLRYLVAYRNAQRYIEEFRQIERKEIEEEKIEIKDEGAYLITGGTGGLGLLVARYLALHGKVNLALLNRSQMPERDKWDAILAVGENEKLAGKIRAIRELEEMGATVNCYSANISNMEDVKGVIEKVRKEYGRINGIVHGAGVAGDGFIIRKDEKVFKSVIDPKIQGTWILDNLTQIDAPDFFVMFSSGVTLTGRQGQGDYTAANSYLDAFAFYRSKQGKKTATINWPVWKEIGMAVDYEVKDDFGLFKAVTNARGLDVFEEVINSTLKRVIPGELNYNMVFALDGKFPIKLSDSLKSMLERKKARLGAGKKSNVTKAKIDVVVKGNKDCNETEVKVAKIWGQVLGLNEIDIYESFYDMGGDSILATQLLKEMDQEFPGVVDISDIFSYSSVVQLSEYIDKKEGRERKSLDEDLELVEETQENDSDQDLMNLLESLETGEATVDSSVEMLKELEWKEDE